MNLENYLKVNKENLIRGEILNFEKNPNENTYNPSRPFYFEGRKYILVRVENIQNNESRVYPYIFENGIWKRIENWPLKNIELEDPAITFINNNFLVSAVEVLDKSNPNNWIIKTNFYYGNNLFELEKFAEGPINMKDIRLIEFEKRIGVFTRPKGRKYRRGRIGYIEIENLDQLKSLDWKSARIIELPILNNEWIGTNDIYYLGNGLLGVLGHIGSKDRNGNLHYYAITFIFNPVNFEVSNFKIIATRDNFPKGECKSERVRDVIFPGALEFENNDWVYLYTGLSDAEIGIFKMPNPFK